MFIINVLFYKFALLSGLLGIAFSVFVRRCALFILSFIFINETLQGYLTNIAARSDLVGWENYPINRVRAFSIYMMDKFFFGMVLYSFASTSHFILTFSLSFSMIFGVTILGFVLAGCSLAENAYFIDYKSYNPKRWRSYLSILT